MAGVERRGQAGLMMRTGRCEVGDAHRVAGRACRRRSVHGCEGGDGVAHSD